MSIHAPYNFVPLSAWIYKPEWGHLVSHDLPFSDGISGTLSIEIEAHTPLIVGGQRINATDDEAGKVWFQTLNGQYAIAGSSLKGMIRNVLEIAAFGKMRAVDDRTLSVRDLTNGAKHIYRDNFMPNAALGKSGVLAGWLSLTQDEEGHIEWRLRPCEYLAVKHRTLIAYAQKQSIEQPEQIKENGSNSVRKYDAWGEQNLAIRFTKRHTDRSGRLVVEADLVNPQAPNGAGVIDGTLVFTGQPDMQKRREFVFYQPEAETKLLPEELVRTFLQVHAGGNRHDPQMNDTKQVWNYWYEKLLQGGEVPVFYLKHGDQVHSLGLAKMYRLAYKHSIAQTIAHTNPGHIDDGQDVLDYFDPDQAPSMENRLYDLPELLFGTVHKKKTNYSLRSRVSFSPALLQSEVQLDTEISTKEVVLNNPKPSYYPSYIHQSRVDGDKLAEGQSYRSYMDPNSEIRGWKRYPTRPMWRKFEIKQVSGKRESNSKKTKTILHPLEQGARFNAVITVHNLRPVELGALAWTLTWGGEPSLRHSLGMGKPFGLGQVSIRITAADLGYINPAKVGQPDISTCLGEFTQHMNSAWRQALKKPDLSWEDSEQLKQLFAMADPRNAPGGSKKLEYMTIDPNEFQAAKGEKRGDPHYVLEPYAAYTGLSDQKLFPRLSDEQRKRKVDDAKLEKQMNLLEMEEEKNLFREFHRDLFDDFNQNSGAAENRANDWCDKKMGKHSETLTRLIAEQLKVFYEKVGKWSADGLKLKQRQRVEKIKKILGET